MPDRAITLCETSLLRASRIFILLCVFYAHTAVALMVCVVIRSISGCQSTPFGDVRLISLSDAAANITRNTFEANHRPWPSPCPPSHYQSTRGMQVSDTKIVRTKDGKSRQFAFVGFTTADDAEEALKYYNQTFLDTSRIQVSRHAHHKQKFLLQMTFKRCLKSGQHFALHRWQWVSRTNAPLRSTSGADIRQSFCFRERYRWHHYRMMSNQTAVS